MKEILGGFKMNIITSILLIVINIIVVRELLKESTVQAEETRPIHISTRLNRDLNFKELLEGVEDTPRESEEELRKRLKEEFRLKIEAERKAWIREYVWNEEDNLLKFQVKYGIIADNSEVKFNEGLFSLRSNRTNRGGGLEIIETETTVSNIPVAV